MTQDTHPNAGRPSGYVDEEGNPIGEDLVNKVTILIAGVQTGLVQIRGDIAAVAQEQTEVKHQLIETEQRQRQEESQNQFRASRLYQEMGAFLKGADARFERYDTILATFEEVARGLGGLSAQLTALDERDAAQYAETVRMLTESQEDRARLHQNDEEIMARLESLQVQLDQYIAGSKRAEVEDLRREIDALKRAQGDGDR